MSKCPNCRKDNAKPKKTWKYGAFNVQSFICGNCGTQYRDYMKDGRQCFTLRLIKGKGYLKA